MGFAGDALCPSQKPVHGNLQNVGKRRQLEIGNGALLPLKQGKGGRADVDAGGLQPREQLVLPHPAQTARLRDPPPDHIPIAERQFARFHASITLPIVCRDSIIIRGKAIDKFGITNYTKFGNTKFEMKWEELDMKIIKRFFLLFLIIGMFLSIMAVDANAEDEGWLWPVPTKLTITSPYIDANSPASLRNKRGGNHSGIDIPGGIVVAARSGEVVLTNNVGVKGGNPCYVILKHIISGQTVYSGYWHLRSGSVMCNVGDYVAQGQQIATAGDTGNAGGVHLHFMIGSSYGTGNAPANTYMSNLRNVNPIDNTYIAATPGSAYTNAEICTGGTINYHIGGSAPVSAYIGRCTAPSALAINDAPAASPSYSNQIGRIPNGETCTVYPDKSSGSWLWVEYNGVQGYAYASYIEYVGPVQAEIATPVISVDKSNAIVGETVTVSWSHVSGANGYTYYLTEEPTGFAYETNVRTGTVTGSQVTFSDLPMGEYCIFIHARNSQTVSGQSNWLSFNIYEQDYIPVIQKNFDGHVYSVYDYEASWTSCKALCEKMGGHLVTINSATENSFICDLIKSGNKDAYWIGATNFESSAANQDGKWNWITGESFSYTNWANGEPSATGGNGTREHWAEVRKTYSYKWNDVCNTNTVGKGFIIEVEPNSADIKARTQYNGHEYLLIDKNATWSEAQGYCLSLGGQLVAINDEGEAAVIDSLIDHGARDWYYVGGVRHNGVWHWLNGTADGQVISSIEWAGNLWPSYCNYLMKYRSNKKYINLPNTYFPEQDISHIGFICEISNPFSVTGGFNGSRLVATVTAPKGALLIAASYGADGRQLGVTSVSIAAEATNRQYQITGLPAGGSYKLMLVSGTIFAPLCPAWNSK